MRMTDGVGAMLSNPGLAETHNLKHAAQVVVQVVRE